MMMPFDATLIRHPAARHELPGDAERAARRLPKRPFHTTLRLRIVRWRARGSASNKAANCSVIAPAN